MKLRYVLPIVALSVFHAAPAYAGTDTSPSGGVIYVPGSSPKTTTVAMWTQVAAALVEVHRLNPMGLDPLPSDEPRNLPGPLGELVRRGWPAAMAEPHRFAHGDVCMPNALFLRRRLVGLVDWTFAHPGPPSRDLASLWLDARLFGPAGAAGSLLYTYEEGVGQLPPALWTFAALGTLLSARRLDTWVEALASTGASPDRVALGRRFDEVVKELTRVSELSTTGGHLPSR